MRLLRHLSVVRHPATVIVRRSRGSHVVSEAGLHHRMRKMVALSIENEIWKLLDSLLGRGCYGCELAFSNGLLSEVGLPLFPAEP